MLFDDPHLQTLQTYRREAVKRAAACAKAFRQLPPNEAGHTRLANSRRAWNRVARHLDDALGALRYAMRNDPTNPKEGAPK